MACTVVNELLQVVLHSNSMERRISQQVVQYAIFCNFIVWLLCWYQWYGTLLQTIRRLIIIKTPNKLATTKLINFTNANYKNIMLETKSADSLN